MSMLSICLSSFWLEVALFIFLSTGLAFLQHLQKFLQRTNKGYRIEMIDVTSKKRTAWKSSASVANFDVSIGGGGGVVGAETRSSPLSTSLPTGAVSGSISQLVISVFPAMV